MRGDDRQRDSMFSYVSAEQRVPPDHPLRTIRTRVDEILRDMSAEFDQLYAGVGRPSSPPERLLMEHLDYNIRFRWFVGLEMDEPIWVPNRHGLVVDAMATTADGTAERDAAMLLLDGQPRRRRRTVGADKHFDTPDFATVSRELGYVPHLSQNVKRAGGSAIDARTTRHPGYTVNQSCRPRFERVFAWLKPLAGLRKVKVRGLPKVDQLFVFACAAFNLKRLPRLLAASG